MTVDLLEITDGNSGEVNWRPVGDIRAGDDWVAEELNYNLDRYNVKTRQAELIPASYIP